MQFANQLQAEGRSKRDAIEHAAAVRLRPILMTTAAMVLGVVPLVIATGAGAASRFAMGIVIATGMTRRHLFHAFRRARGLHADRNRPREVRRPRGPGFLAPGRLMPVQVLPCL